MLEVGPGPGATTDWLRRQVSQLTVVEVDAGAAAALATRFGGTNVDVVTADATALEFADATFDAAGCFTMLHHVPAALQDRLLAEVARVLRPGAPFVGGDSRPSLMWNVFHVFDDRNPVDPATFADRLTRAGFVDAEIPYMTKTGFGWRARRG